MKSNIPVASLFYDEPKRHKINVSLKPIVSLHGTLTSNLLRKIKRTFRKLVDK